MNTLPLRIRLLLWWSVVKVRVLNVIHPLTDEQKAADADDLVNPPQDDTNSDTNENPA